MQAKLIEYTAMPKVLLYITARITWTFLFFGTDVNENRAHVHVGKQGTEMLAKFWLEPQVELANKGSLSDAQLKQIQDIIEANKATLLNQWKNFKAGKQVKMIKIQK